VLLGVITIPIGCIAGGLSMNLTPYKISMGEIMVNLIPAIIVAALVAAGLALRPRQLMRGFCKIGDIMQWILTAGIVLAAVQSVTGLRLPLFRLMVEPSVEGGISPLTDSLIIVGSIALVLTGAFPMVLWISRTFQRPIRKLSAKLGMNEAGGAGLIASLASVFPALDLIKDMNVKGRLLVLTFSVSASFVFGDHLGFTAGVNQDMVLPMIVSKLVGGLTALILANIMAPKLLKTLKDS
jgi:ethanolamine transporter